MDMDHSDSMGGMGEGEAMCKISMLWNWNTVDSCFLSSTWHIRSNGMFAGSCVGVVLLVMSLEFLRRSVKEYDGFLLRKHAEHQAQSPPVERDTTSTLAPIPLIKGPSGYRPTILEQAIRSLLHMVQFAVAYLIMLLAMYYNGYIIICIFIGAYLGAFVFQWERLGVHSRSGLQTSAAKEATVCCG